MPNLNLLHLPPEIDPAMLMSLAAHPGTLPAVAKQLTKWSEKIAKKRQKSVAKIEQAYQQLIREVGPDFARQEWQKVGKKPRGKPKGSTNPEDDSYLLIRYSIARCNANQPHLIKSLPRRLAATLHEENKGAYGASPEAIATKLRRLLKKGRSEPQRLAADTRRHNNISGSTFEIMLSSQPVTETKQAS